MNIAIKGRSPVAAASHGLVHQFMCAAAMVGGHVAANYSEIAMKVVMHPVTNMAMMGMAAWCWYEGDKHWIKRRGELASAFEKVSIRSLIAATGLGMMAMHVPGYSHELHEHQMHGSSQQAWFERQSAEQKRTIIGNAKAMNMPLDKYLNNLCGQTVPPQPKGELK